VSVFAPRCWRLWSVKGKKRATLTVREWWFDDDGCSLDDQHAFQACLIDRSSISPFRINHLRTVWESLAQNAPSSPRRPLCNLESSVYGPADPAYSWKLCQTSECLSLTSDSVSHPTVQIHLVDASATRSVQRGSLTQWFAKRNSASRTSSISCLNSSLSFSSAIRASWQQLVLKGLSWCLAGTIVGTVLVPEVQRRCVLLSAML